jgi:hypothetical protein
LGVSPLYKLHFLESAADIVQVYEEKAKNGNYKNHPEQKIPGDLLGFGFFSWASFRGL